MSVTVTDEVDVIRYILLTNMLASNIQIGGNDANLLIKNRHDLPNVRWQKPRQIMVRTFGGTGNIKVADLFYEFEDRNIPVSILVETNIKKGRGAIISAKEEVKRALYDARKIIDFDDSGVNDTAIKNRYDIIKILSISDASQNEDGIHKMTFLVDLQTRAQSI